MTGRDAGHTLVYMAVDDGGINDALALRRADVSVSQHGAAGIATDTARVVFLEGNLARMNELFDIAEDLLRLRVVNARGSVPETPASATNTAPEGARLSKWQYSAQLQMNRSNA
jgi:high-affinity K+ transport system ATPase subunit B